MKTIILSLLPFLILSCTPKTQVDRTKQPQPGPAPTIDLGKAETFSLKNGLKVIVVENHKLPRVSVTLFIDNPPVFEGEKSGVSQLTGSLLGSGTKSVSKDAFNEEVDFLGASISFSSFTAQAQALTKYFPRIFELMADAALNPVFTKEELEKERALLLSAIKSSERSVPRIAARVQNALNFGKDHPYGDFPTAQTVTQVKLVDVQKFHSSYFKPNNGYLVIVGDITAKKIEGLVNKHFFTWKKGTIPKGSYAKPTNVKKTEIDFVDMPHAVQSEISIVGTVDLRMRDPDFHAVLLANHILGGGANGYLFMNLREAKGFTYGAYSRLNVDKYVSSFSASASVRNAVTGQAIAEALNEIKRIRSTKATENALQIAKSAYTGHFLLALEDPQTIAGYALKIETRKLPRDFYETYLQKIDAVTIKDIERVAQKYIPLENARIVITGKGADVLAGLEKLPYEIHYYDTQANPVKKPGDTPKTP